MAVGASPKPVNAPVPDIVALQRPHYLDQGDSIGGASQRKAASGSPDRFHQAFSLEFVEHLADKVIRDVLAAADLAGATHGTGLGQINKRAEGIFTFFGEEHRTHSSREILRNPKGRSRRLLYPGPTIPRSPPDLLQQILGSTASADRDISLA